MLAIEAVYQGQLGQSHPRSKDQEAEEELTPGVSLQQQRFDAVIPEGIGANLKLRTLDSA